jgi:SAM-dependent methyltransferase
MAALTAAAVLQANLASYEGLYSKQGAFLRYPDDWLVRFHTMTLRDRLPGRALDYGCGGGNNAVFLAQKGWEVHGVDVAPSFRSLVKQNLARYGLPESILTRFKTIDPASTILDYPNGMFDFVLSNQVLYYLPSEDHLKQVCAELERVLAPGGIFFATMMGPKNYYIAEHTVEVENGIHDVRITTPGHRLEGVRELILLIRDTGHLTSVFDAFEPLTTGFFDQGMFDMRSNFHWIFAGTKLRA